MTPTPAARAYLEGLTQSRGALALTCPAISFETAKEWAFDLPHKLALMMRDGEITHLDDAPCLQAAPVTRHEQMRME